jgi:hypothetical protein
VHLAGVFDDRGEGSVITLTQEQIAELPGTAGATTNRVLRKQQEKGRIESKRGSVRIVDLESLAKRNCCRLAECQV